MRTSNTKFFNRLNNYFNKILLNHDDSNIEKIYKIAYPILYKEVYYFWLHGQTIKCIKRSQSLNKVIKFKSAIQNVKFILYFHLQTPYLIF